MKNDILIDTNIAKDFASPPDDAYKNLIEWLLKENEGKPEKDAVLVLCQKLVVEYHRSNIGSSAASNILTLINILTKQGRVTMLKAKEIKDFQAKYFTKQVHKRLTCNHEDRELIPVVLLSDRKFALTKDNALANDLVNFSGFDVYVAQSPENLPYAEDWSEK